MTRSHTVLCCTFRLLVGLDWKQRAIAPKEQAKGPHESNRFTGLDLSVFGDAGDQLASDKTQALYGQASASPLPSVPGANVLGYTLFSPPL